MNPLEPIYYYFYRSHETESELCRLELKVLLGEEGEEGSGGNADRGSAGIRSSAAAVDPGRSPYLSGVMEVWSASGSVEDICRFAAELPPGETSFRVSCPRESEGSYEERLELERRVGRCIRGRADLRSPGQVYGIVRRGGVYAFGPYREADRSWQARRIKPHPYSTGLGVGLSRSLVNLAVPDPEQKRVIDPCCGMGNVLIEGFSMGVRMSGCDLNPLAVRGARGNLRHFGYPEDAVRLADMRSLEGTYDAAVLDMPYNLCSVLPPEEALEMLRALRRLTGRAVIVSTQPLEREIGQAGFRVEESCAVSKSSLTRFIWICR
ncbi:TRM11 family SAM-dependent methyltransferase [Paenibacillus glufosinatiresistens]|uniref:TRM11 family SAM-dependent methyltransferase n=1 Tax=Paenibacillus glufosinatiresistens TaxID=3070657 RepID=UPI00286D79D5|nr:RNA methyltransferase [Paenibacillus sp. YX.27]